MVQMSSKKYQEISSKMFFPFLFQHHRIVMEISKRPPENVINYFKMKKNLT